MKAGWWDAPLVLQDLAVSKLHVHSLTLIGQSLESRVQHPEIRVQRLGSRVQRTEPSVKSPQFRDSGMPVKPKMSCENKN